MTRLITLFSVFLIFFGMHTQIPLAVGGRLLIPQLFSFVGAVCILFVNVSRIKFRVVVLYTALTAVLMVFAVITAQNDHNLSQHILSTGLLLYSLVIAYGTFIGLQVLGLKRTSRFFFIAAMILIIGSFLELYGGLRPVSDAFRQAFDGWSYSADIRDVQEYGGIRPKFFSPEPAILGSMTGYAVLFWFLSARRFSWLRLLGSIFLTLSAFFLIRSPTILLCGGIIAIFFLSEFGRKKISHMRTVVLGITAMGVVLIAPVIVVSTTQYGGSPSFFEREVGPPLVAAGVLRSQPLLGTGIGGWTQVVTYGTGVFNKAGGSSYRQLQSEELSESGSDEGKDMIANAFWEFWVDLGLVGGIFFVWFLWWVIGELAVPHRFVVFICGAVILTMGGALVRPRYWVGLFTLACLDQMRTADRAQEEEKSVSNAHPIESDEGLRQWAN